MFLTRAIVLFSFALVSLLVSCSEEPATGPNTDGSTKPRAGSTYRFHRYNADTTGQPIPGSSDTLVRTLVATDLQHAGESSVHLFAHGGDSVRLRYEANGDVRYYPGWGGATLVGWITLPVASKGTSQRTLRDTVIDLGNGQSGRNRVTLTVSYLSSEKVAVGGDSLDAHRMRVEIVDVNPLTPELNLTITRRHTVWYAPRLGYFARVETVDMQENPYSTIVEPTAVSELIDYELK